LAAKLTRLTHKIARQLHLVPESCTMCSSRSRRPVRKLLDTLSYNLRPASGHLKWITGSHRLSLVDIRYLSNITQQFVHNLD